MPPTKAVLAIFTCFISAANLFAQGLSIDRHVTMILDSTRRGVTTSFGKQGERPLKFGQRRDSGYRFALVTLLEMIEHTERLELDEVQSSKIEGLRSRSFSVKARMAQIMAGKPSMSGILLLTPKQKTATLNNEKIAMPDLLRLITVRQQTIKAMEMEMARRPITK